VTLVSHECREPVQPGFDQLRGELAVRQPDLAQALAVSVEVRHRGPQHAVLARGALKELVVGGERQRDHHEKAAGRAVPADVAGREALAKPG
jgi:hypothetical protein